MPSAQAYDMPPPDTQRQRYEEAARAGNLDAQFGLGLLLEQAAARETGETENMLLADAVFWYRAAAEQRHADAWNNLGALYYDGRGVPKDLDEAVYCYRRAATLGSAAGRYNLALLIARQRAAGNNGEVVQLLRDSADQGFANAQAQLGRLYRDGDMVPVDLNESARLFRLAAEQGHGWAQYYLGLSLLRGEGGARNIEEAYMWISRAAERDIPPALYQQGVMLDLGLGTLADPDRARELWGRALQLGVPEAALKLGVDPGQAPPATSGAPYEAAPGPGPKTQREETPADMPDSESGIQPNNVTESSDQPRKRSFWRWGPRSSPSSTSDVKP